MNKKINIISKEALYLLIIFFAIACEEILDVDINQIPQKLVVNGSVSTTVEKTQVFLSLSSNVFKDEINQNISGAMVTISDDLGKSEALTEREPGLYKATSFYGTPGRIYTLKINYKGELYTSVSKMPEQMTLDSLRFFYNPGNFNIGFPFTSLFFSYDMKCYLKNKKGIEEFCVLKLFDEQTKNSVFRILYQDKYSDGEQVIIERNGLAIDPYTNYSLEIISVDKEVYNYLYQLEEKGEEWGSDVLEMFGNSSFNPKSNVNNALGYFTASSYKSYSVRLNMIRAN
jgi:hypothetical protein